MYLWFYEASQKIKTQSQIDYILSLLETPDSNRPFLFAAASASFGTARVASCAAAAPSEAAGAGGAAAAGAGARAGTALGGRVKGGTPYGIVQYH